MTIEELLETLGIVKDKQAEARKSINAFLDGAYVPKSRIVCVGHEVKYFHCPS